MGDGGKQTEKRMVSRGSEGASEPLPGAVETQHHPTEPSPWSAVLHPRAPPQRPIKRRHAPHAIEWFSKKYLKVFL